MIILDGSIAELTEGHLAPVRQVIEGNGRSNPKASKSSGTHLVKARKGTSTKDPSRREQPACHAA
jgi:hypothetical protein